jgi:hypothetical protein
MIFTLLNVVGGSAKRRDMIREINLDEVSKALGCEQLETRKGLNQEQCLKRPRYNRWSSIFLDMGAAPRPLHQSMHTTIY